MADPGSIRAGKAIVEIGGDKQPFEEAVVASQDVLDKFAAQIDSSVAPVAKLEDAISGLASVGGNLVDKLGFGDVAISIEGAMSQTTAFVGEAASMAGGLADVVGNFKQLKAAGVGTLTSIVEWGAKAVSVVGGIAAAIGASVAAALLATKAYFDMTASIAQTEGELIEKQGKEIAAANAAFEQRMIAANAARRAEIEASFDAGVKRAEEYAAMLRYQEEQRKKAAQEAEEAHSKIAKRAEAELEKLKTPAERLADKLAEIAEFSAAGVIDGAQADALARHEAERLARQGIIPSEATDMPAQALASSMLRGSAEAADTIAKNQAAVLRPDKADEQVAQQKRTNELLEEGNRLAREKKSDRVEVFGGA